MKQQQAHTPETNASFLDRPFPLIVVTVLSYAIAVTITMSPRPADSSPAASAPTPYSDDHARIVNEEPQPPSF